MITGILIAFALSFSPGLFAFEDIRQVKAAGTHCANAKKYAYEAELASAELKKLKIEKTAVAGAEAGLSAGLKGSLSGWAKAFEAWEKIPTPADYQESKTCPEMIQSHNELHRCNKKSTQDWKKIHRDMKSWADKQADCVNGKEPCSLQPIPKLQRSYWEVTGKASMNKCVSAQLMAQGRGDAVKYVGIGGADSSYDIFKCKDNQDFTPLDAQFPKVAGERLSQLRKRLKQMEQQISRKESDFKQYSTKAKAEKDIADKIAAAQKVPNICDAEVKDYSQEAAKLKADTEALLKKAQELLAAKK